MLKFLTDFFDMINNIIFSKFFKLIIKLNNNNNFNFNLILSMEFKKYLNRIANR